MASRFNTQVAVINSNSASVTVIANPSKSAFMYIWELLLTSSGTSNLTLNNVVNGSVGPLSGPYALVVNGSLYLADSGGATPHLTIDPGGSLTITNSGSVQLSGQCKYSN